MSLAKMEAQLRFVILFFSPISGVSCQELMDSWKKINSKWKKKCEINHNIKYICISCPFSLKTYTKRFYFSEFLFIFKFLSLRLLAGYSHIYRLKEYTLLTCWFFYNLFESSFLIFLCLCEYMILYRLDFALVPNIKPVLI